ncbi:MAG: hypothetical protein ABIH40_05600 [Candidatus Omnitrophota bacterium]
MVKCGLFCLIPAVFLLAVSFFVLFAVSKTDSRALKKFGVTIAVLFWILTGLLLILSVYFGISGKSAICPLEYPWRHHWGYQQMMR